MRTKTAATHRGEQDARSAAFDASDDDIDAAPWMEEEYSAGDDEAIDLLALGLGASHRKRPPARQLIERYKEDLWLKKQLEEGW